MSTNLLEIESLHAGYGKAEVLSGINLELPKGAVVTVIGPNGAGKSTLTNLLSGDLPTTSGQITLAGRDVTGWSPERISRQGLGRSYQKTNIFAPFTVWENVRLAAQSRDAQQPWNPLRWLQIAGKSATALARATRAIELAGLESRRCFCLMNRWPAWAWPRPSAWSNCCSSSRKTTPCCWSNTTWMPSSRWPTI